jgi:hypothetical protein
MKLCKDCKWSNKSEVLGSKGDNIFSCKNPQNQNKPHINIVSGNSWPSDRLLCNWQRKQGWIRARITGACGSDGRWFEAK